MNPKPDWHLEGVHAYFEGKELEDNPYKKGTEAHTAWANGWLSAKTVGGEK
jgi:ribosome modulation factor